MMTTSQRRHKRLGELFLAICDLSEEAQAQIVDQLEPSDISLKDDLLAMLRQHRLAETTGEHAPSPLMELDSGVIVGDRYRIVTPLGRGGMGIVYRADDLLLAQPVALKFLADGNSDQPRWLDSLRREVLFARRVSHPNVCRIFDLVRADGYTFLTMEYVDGEDLESLLKRLGRLPHEKAQAVAWELCLGLSAIHAAGLLHRDLKPSNVMVDGRGRVRIADFGIASLIASDPATERMAGTPAYMAPEVLAGAAAHIRSDLYALGLVLFKLFTGRSFHNASSPGSRSGKESITPSRATEELDQRTERAILHCLESNPNRRPSSALAVAAELTGRSVLGAAVAAGETLTPDLVAAAQRERIAPRPARLALAGIILGLFASVALSSKTTPMAEIPFDKPPEVLAEKARDVLRLVGATEPIVDRAWGFSCDWVPLRRLRGSSDQGPAPRDHSGLGRFWYREATTSFFAPQRKGRVDWQSPGRLDPGMRSVLLDPGGRLREFLVVPREKLTSQHPSLDFRTLFQAAGLDFGRFSPSDPRTTPAVFVDTRLAWVGSTAEQPGRPLVVEATSLAGQPVSFTVHDSREQQADLVRQGLAEKLSRQHDFQFSLRLSLLMGFVILAAHQLSGGRSDRRGAGRLAAVIALVSLAAWFLQAHHVRSVEQEYDLILQGISQCLLEGGLTWLFYIAVEPEVRRLWPEAEISWSRVLSGRWRDRLAASHVLIGIFFGVLETLIIQAGRLASQYSGIPPYIAEANDMIEQLGLQTPVATLLRVFLSALMETMGMLSTLVLFVRLLRSRTLAVMVCGPLCVAMISNWQQLTILSLVLGVTVSLIRIYIMMKWGLLAAITAVFYRFSMRFLPITPDLECWYGYITPMAVGLWITLAIAAYHLSQQPEPEERPLWHGL